MSSTPARAGTPSNDIIIMDPPPPPPQHVARPPATISTPQSRPLSSAGGPSMGGNAVASGSGSGSGKNTDRLSGIVDLKAEEDASRSASLAARPGPTPSVGPLEQNRHRKQTFLDVDFLRRKMAEVATLKHGLYISTDAPAYMALAAEGRIRGLLEEMVRAKRHRLETSARPEPSNYPGTDVAMWDVVLTSDSGKQLGTIERVEREEEGRRRRERMRRDEEARAREREREEERERRERMGEPPLPDDDEEDLVADAGGEKDSMEGVVEDPSTTSTGATPSGQPPSSPVQPSTDGQPPKKKKKTTTSLPGTTSTTDGTTTPSTSTPKPPKPKKSTVKGISEQAQKRVSNSVALQSAGIARKSWMLGGGTGGMGSPSPAARPGQKKKDEGGSVGSPLANVESNSTDPPSATGGAAGGGWAKPFLSSSTSTPLLPPTPTNGLSSSSHPFAFNPLSSSQPEESKVSLQDALWVLEKEVLLGPGGRSRAGVNRVVRKVMLGVEGFGVGGTKVGVAAFGGGGGVGEVRK